MKVRRNANHQIQLGELEEGGGAVGEEHGADVAAFAFFFVFPDAL